MAGGSRCRNCAGGRSTTTNRGKGTRRATTEDRSKTPKHHERPKEDATTCWGHIAREAGNVSPRRLLEVAPLPPRSAGPDAAHPHQRPRPTATAPEPTTTTKARGTRRATTVVVQRVPSPSSFFVVGSGVGAACLLERPSWSFGRPSRGHVARCAGFMSPACRGVLLRPFRVVQRVPLRDSGAAVAGAAATCSGWLAQSSPSFQPPPSAR